MRFQTTNGRAHGVPEIAFTVDEPSLADHAARMLARIEARIARGERWSAGQLFDLDGWPAELVAGEHGVLDLHGQDLALPRDAPPVYYPGVTPFVRVSAAQWAVADACGVAPGSEEGQQAETTQAS